MKKVLVSDYDQTFYLNNEDIEKNKIAVKNFRELGNIFMIATGRSYIDFKNKVELYNIKYDYVILNHGTTILDSNDNVIYNYCINNEIINSIKNDLEIDKAIKTFCCSKLESRVDFDYKNLTKIHVKYDNKELAMSITDKMNKKYNNFINAYYVTGNAIEIISNETNKSLSIKLLIKDLCLNEDNVWTIGDGYSDIEMVKDFNGCCMKESVPELKKLTSNEFNSVSELIMQLIKESNIE